LNAERYLVRGIQREQTFGGTEQPHHLTRKNERIVPFDRAEMCVETLLSFEGLLVEQLSSAIGIGASSGNVTLAHRARLLRSDSTKRNAPAFTVNLRWRLIDFLSSGSALA